MGSSFKIFSLNIGMKNNLGGLRDLIIEYKFDMIYLQEIRLTNDELQAKINNLGYHCQVNIDMDELSKPGTAIVYKSSLPVTDIQTLVKCRAQVAFVRNFAFLNIYAPSGSQNRLERGIFFSRDLFTGFLLNPNCTWLMGGDFNAILQKLDIENDVGFHQKKCPQLSDLVSGMDFHDVFRALYPNKREFTFLGLILLPQGWINFVFQNR